MSGIVALYLHPPHSVFVLHFLATESLLLVLLLLSSGILVPFPYFLSLFFYPSLGGSWANEGCPLHGWSQPIAQGWPINHGCSARRGRGQAEKAAQVGLFRELLEERPWGLIMGCRE